MPAPVIASHRRRLLHAMGVTPYALRVRAGGDEPVVAEHAAATGGAEEVGCVLMLPGGYDRRQLAVLEQAMRSLGAGFAPAVHVTVVDGQPSGPVPAASAYLAFGEAQAHALGRNLSAEVMAAADVVLLDQPQTLLQADGKRRLWQALGGVRRHWRRT